MLLLALMGRQSLPESFKELKGLISLMFPQGIYSGRKDALEERTGVVLVVLVVVGGGGGGGEV